jgi:hypothetical protein
MLTAVVVPGLVSIFFGKAEWCVTPICTRGHWSTYAVFQKIRIYDFLIPSDLWPRASSSLIFDNAAIAGVFLLQVTRNHS